MSPPAGPAPLKRLLLISPHFPPVNAPDMYRAVSALPYLASMGWEASVLCVDPRDVAAPKDPRMRQFDPPGVSVRRCRAFPLSVSSLAGMRTLGWRAWRGLERAGRQMIRASRPDLVFFTTTQHPLLCLGARWKREFGVPYVVDLQDPWLTDYYSRPGSPRPPGGWKYRVAHAIAARLEPAAFEPADGFVSVSDHYLQDLGRRYPWFGSRPQVTIPFGIDEQAFQKAVVSAPAAFERRPGCLHLVSVGAAGPIMEKGLKALFEQLAALRREAPEAAESLRIHLIGTSYAPAGTARPTALPIAQALGVGDLVSEQTSRVDWQTAQATMRAADGVIVLGSDDPAYTPSKFAGAFLARRPGLVLAPADSGAGRVNAELGFGMLLDPTGKTPLALRAFLADIASASPSWPGKRQEAMFASTHTAIARTRQLTAFLDDVCRISANRASS